MDGWIRIYAGHDPQVEQDRQELERAGIPTQVVESQLDVVNSPVERLALPATELHVPVEHEERARQVLDLPLDYDAPQRGTLQWASRIDNLGIPLAAVLCGYSVVVSSGPSRFVACVFLLLFAWLTYHTLRPGRRDDV